MGYRMYSQLVEMITSKKTGEVANGADLATVGQTAAVFRLLTTKYTQFKHGGTKLRYYMLRGAELAVGALVFGQMLHNATYALSYTISYAYNGLSSLNDFSTLWNSLGGAKMLTELPGFQTGLNVIVQIMGIGCMFSVSKTKSWAELAEFAVRTVILVFGTMMHPFLVQSSSFGLEYQQFISEHSLCPLVQDWLTFLLDTPYSRYKQVLTKTEYLATLRDRLTSVAAEATGEPSEALSLQFGENMAYIEDFLLALKKPMQEKLGYLRENNLLLTSPEEGK